MTNALNITLVFLFFLTGKWGFGQDTTAWTFYQCIEQGWVANITIQQSELNIQNTGYDLEKNRAQYHPTLNATFNNGYNWGRSIDPTTYQFVNGSVFTSNVNLNARMVLFDGFIIPTRIQQSIVNLEHAEGQLEQQKNQVAMNIASAYLQILLAHEKVDLIISQLTITRRLRDNTKKYYEQDLRAEADLLLIESQLAREISDSMEAVNTLHLAKLSLMQWMEIPFVPDFRIERFNPGFVETITSFVFPPSQAIYDSALVHLPEIYNAGLNVTYQELELKAAQGSYYPTVSLNGSVGSNYASSSKIVTQTQYAQEIPIGYVYSNPSELVYGTEISTVPSFSNYSYFKQMDDHMNTSLILGLSVPIYNRKQVSTTVDKAIVNISKAELELQSQKNMLRKDIETDYLEYILLKSQLETTKIKLDAYRESFRKLEKEFQLQLANSYDLLVEKNKINTAESEIAQARYRLLFKFVILRYYQSGQVAFPY